MLLGGQPRSAPSVGSPALPTFGVPFHLGYAYALWHRTSKFDVVSGNTYEEVLFLGVSHAPPAQALSNFGGSVLFMPELPLVAELPIWLGNTWAHGEGRVSWGQPRLSSQDSRVLIALPNFGGSPVFTPIPFKADLTTKSGMITRIGRDVFLEVSHAVAFAQMRRAVCQRQLNFLWLLIEGAIYRETATTVSGYDDRRVRPNHWWSINHRPAVRVIDDFSEAVDVSDVKSSRSEHFFFDRNHRLSRKQYEIGTFTGTTHH